LKRRRRWALAFSLFLIGLVGLGRLARERPSPRVGTWLEAAGLRPEERVLAGRRIRFVRAGSGPPLVLIHGLASSLYTWQAALPRLASRYQVIALDLPGFGGSEQPPDLAFEDLVATVAALLEALELESSSLVGNSLGGATAAAVAARWPERVRALVLIDAAGFQHGLDDAPALVRYSLWLPPALVEWLPLRRPFTRLALEQVFHDDSKVTGERVEEYLAPLLRPGALASFRSLLSARPEDLARMREGLPEISAPTLVVWGSEDAWIPASHAERFRAAIPEARVERLPGCGHMPQEECPEALLSVLELFLGRHAPLPGEQAAEAGR
jgi:pimeloyl-ACP methyl ester carboxylesterase